MSLWGKYFPYYVETFLLQLVQWMRHTDLKISVDDAQWDIAVRREEILRTALTKKRFCAEDVSVACKQLGIGTA
ncbi:MAG: hypothetical protein P8Y36_06505, partial [Alphaproteobacteria bacterium]